MGKTPYVIYWNNIPAPYMVERFNAVADRGLIDFEAWFNDRLQADRSWVVDESKWRFKYRYISTTSFFGRAQHWPLGLLRSKPDVLISLYARPSFLIGWLLAKLRGIKTGFWVETTFDSWVQRKALKERLKSLVFPHVDAIITVGEDGRAFAKQYGVEDNQVFYAPHVIDIHHYVTKAREWCFNREHFRRQLSLRGTVFLYVGRLWWGKGIRYLLEAFEQVQMQNEGEVSLLIVGDGPEEESLKKFCADKHLLNVTFVGFKQKHEIPRYYVLADVFVFPTLGDPYGMVVDEAMACSLPVISTNAAGEIRSRVTDGENGYIVPPADAKALADRMSELVLKPVDRAQMGELASKKMMNHTPERWAEDLENIVMTLLK